MSYISQGLSWLPLWMCWICFARRYESIECYYGFIWTPSDSAFVFFYAKTVLFQFFLVRGWHGGTASPKAGNGQIVTQLQAPHPGTKILTYKKPCNFFKFNGTRYLLKGQTFISSIPESIFAGHLEIVGLSGSPRHFNLSHIRTAPNRRTQ